MKTELINNTKKRMDGAIGSLNHNLAGLRTGRASPNMVDHISVEMYGDRMPISSLATVSIPEPRMISIQAWDKASVKPIEKAIITSNLGINPVIDGQIIRLPMMPLSEEARQKLVKVAHTEGEQAKIALRNVRRDSMDELKKHEKDSGLSKDDIHNIGEEIQKVTDDYIKKIDEILKIKEKEILSN